MTPSEFPRPFDRRHLPAHGVFIAASPEECAALAQRFGLRACHRLEADIAFEAVDQGVWLRGTVRGDVIQACAVSGEDVPARVEEPIRLLFAQERKAQQEEIELADEDCDVLPLEGSVIDAGEAAAQTLLLALDPYPVGPAAESARREAGLLDERACGPFAALAGLIGPAEAGGRDNS